MVGLGFPEPGETVAELAMGLLCFLLILVACFG